MSLQELVDAVFKKLTLTYGRDFLGRWEGVDLNDVKADWAHELRGYERAPYAIKYALQHLPPRPPTVIEFKLLCVKAPAQEAPRLTAPKSDKAKATALIADARKKMMEWKK